MTDLLREVLLSLADPPAAEAPPLADLEWRQRRRRRRRVTGRASAVGVCLVVLVGGVVSLDRSPDGSQPAAAPPDVASTVAPPTSPSTTAVADPSTCRNSYNASCGPFRWEPTPPEYPITVDVTYEPADPRVGETVTFTVTARRGAGSALARVVESGDGGSPMADPQIS